MKPLKVALIVKNDNSKARSNRNMGYFSYPVPEFEWNHFTPGKRFNLKRNMFKEFDLIIHEDAPLEGNWIGNDVPLIFLDIDSTLSIEHFTQRFNQASQSDLVLVDHDNLMHFKKINKPVKRFNYCVNDKVFYPSDKPKALDFVFHCSNNHTGGEARSNIRKLLDKYAKANFLQYRSGAIALDQYADNFRNSLIVVNQSRTPHNRPHRIFDALASKACLLTSQFAYVAHDGLQENENYVSFADNEQLIQKLDYLLNNRAEIERIANNGYNLVKDHHTWEIRAKELRELIQCELSL